MAGQRLPVIPLAIRGGGPVFEPASSDDCRLVRDHLERILASAVFRNSKRYASVLKYVVDRTLEGAACQLKERTIGVEVFGRAPDYDTSTDHVVRSAVAEIRKRLAQYYQEEGQQDDLRVDLQPGSYVPVFRLVAEAPAPGVGEEHAEPAPPAPPPGPATRVSRAAIVWCTAAGLFAAAAVGIWLNIRWFNDPLDKFWHPVLESSNPIVLCVGNLEGGRGIGSALLPGPHSLAAYHSLSSQMVHVADATSLCRFAGLLQSKGKPYRIESQSEATFADLQSGPAVLVGLLNNDWAGRLTPRLRFTIERPTGHSYLIRDGKNPLRNDWTIDFDTPLLDVTRDYALVLRSLDPKTDQMVVLVGGLSIFGTLAASELLTTPSGIRKLDAALTAGWERRNLELVLSTEVIKGKSGHATIAAWNSW